MFVNKKVGEIYEAIMLQIVILKYSPGSMLCYMLQVFPQYLWAQVQSLTFGSFRNSAQLHGYGDQTLGNWNQNAKKVNLWVLTKNRKVTIYFGHKRRGSLWNMTYTSIKRKQWHQSMKKSRLRWRWKNSPIQPLRMSRKHPQSLQCRVIYLKMSKTPHSRPPTTKKLKNHLSFTKIHMGARVA